MTEDRVSQGLALIMRIRQVREVRDQVEKDYIEAEEMVLFELGWTKVAPDERVRDGRDDLWVRPNSPDTISSADDLEKITVTREEAITEVIEVHGDRGRVSIQRRETARTHAGGNGHGPGPVV